MDRLFGSGVALAAISSSLYGVSADLPVHCLRHQIEGEWKFVLSPSEPKRSSCGHRSPDNQDNQPPLNFLDTLGAETVKTFNLMGPNTASSGKEKGTWTMIYDEGFEVQVADFTYFAFSKFEWVNGANGKTNVSHCGMTQVGWYHNTNRDQWGCYVGKKVGSEDDDSSSASADDQAPTQSSQLSLASTQTAVDSTTTMDLSDFTTTMSMTAFKPDSKEEADELQRELALVSQTAPPEPSTTSQDINLQSAVVAAEDQQFWSEPAGTTTAAPASDDMAGASSNDASFPQSKGYDSPMETDFQESVADALNFLQLGWKAHPYPMFTGRSPRQVNKFAGVQRSRPKAQAFAQEPVSSFLGVSRRVSRMRNERSFDWRSVDGKNWLTPVVQQGDCGSCYTISTVHMLTARNRINKKDIKEPSFSVMFPLYCSEYNQGCDGGYGFLQSKWSEDVGLVPEGCAPFSLTGPSSCMVDPKCNLGQQRYRASGHHYVGGYYGASDEESIKRELVQHGPAVMSFEPREDFMYYKTGVYKSVANKIHQEWEQVDHAVLAVGFGEDSKQGGYWTIQNSWGDDWGEEGFFRMARGSDESGCESIVVAADVVEEERNSALDDFLASIK